MAKHETAALLLCAALLSAALPVGAQTASYVVDDGDQVTLPQCYAVTAVIDRAEDGSFLEGLRNIRIDKNDHLFVADAGNDRVLEYDEDHVFLRSYTAGGTLGGPAGMYHDTDTGELYIADTGNERVVIVDGDDRILREYHRPDSAFLDDAMRFDPSNVAVGVQGYLYVLKGQYFMQLDREGEFRGFMGSTRVGASFVRWLIRKFASEKQKQTLTTEQPSPYLNFTTDDDGMLWAVASTSTAQIRRINMAGDNLYPEAFYGERVQDVSGKYSDPNFISIAVSDDKIVSVLEEKSCRIYQYSQSGTMLNVFGGKGEVKGFFQDPVSVATDSSGAVYVADRALGNIQVFSRTAFAAAVYRAQAAYDEGSYEEAYGLYEDARALDPNYAVVNKGIAACLYKLGRTEEAAAAYRAADDRASYGTLQTELRAERIKRHFGLVCLAVVAVAVGAVLLVRQLRRRADRAVARYYHLDDPGRDGRQTRPHG